MKKYMMLMVATLSVALTGCASIKIPPVERETAARQLGQATAVIVITIIQNTHNENVFSPLYAVTSQLGAVLPAEGQTYAETAMPFINGRLDALVEDGRLSPLMRPFVSDILGMVITTIDYNLQATESMDNIHKKNAIIIAYFDGFNGLLRLFAYRAYEPYAP